MANRRIIEGLHFINSNTILLIKKSVVWKESIIHINNKPYYRLLPYKEHAIKTENIKNMYTLAINNQIIYENTDIFEYKIHIKYTNDIKYTNGIKYTNDIKYRNDINLLEKEQLNTKLILDDMLFCKK